ncbi:MAG: hypothetical protein CL935_03875 [Deltaproteobacteria bacterium]|nr:hypothetical protein [Deltaproteobacteria bacterium]
MFKKKELLIFKTILITKLILFAIQVNISAVEDELALKYNWIPQYYGKIEGESKLLYTRSFSRSQLRFVDIDGDNDIDLFVGKSDGRIAYFLNEGSRNTPLLKLITEDYEVLHSGVDEQSNPTLFRTILDVGGNSAPEFVDIDNDGDLDMFIGSQDGHIFHYENRGNRLSPRFFRNTPIYMGLKFDGNSIPRFADLNGDRAFDMIVGTRSGKIHLILNSGISEEAIFCEEYDVVNPPDVRCKYQPLLIADIFQNVDVVPELVDWDQDGDLDLFAGKSDGKIDFYLNIGDRFVPNWKIKSKHFQFIDVGGFVSPTFYDLNNDNYPELFLGTATSRIIKYENHEILTSMLNKIKSFDPNYFDKSSSVESILSSACKELNGFPECLIELKKAFSVPEGQKIEKLKDFNEYIFREDLSIDSIEDEFADSLDNNLKVRKKESNATIQENVEIEQDPEQSGSDDGKSPNRNIEILKKHGIITRNQLLLSSRNYLKIENLVGSDRHVFVNSGDWNNDGRKDILLGSRSGEIYAFENRADKGTDWYQIKFQSLQRNKRNFSAPVLSDLDDDGDLDIISGNRNGKIEWLLNRGTDKIPEWVIHDLNVSQIDVGSFSKPLLSDMDGDKDLDLLIGNSKGLIIYYENQGDKSKPHFVLRNTRISGIQMKGNSSPALWTWNNDEYPDLIVGGREGFLSLVSHLPPKRLPALRGWNLEATHWQKIKSAGYSTPHFSDLDEDNKSDMLIGDIEGNLRYWINGGQSIKKEDDEVTKQILVENTLEDEDQEVVLSDSVNQLENPDTEKNSLKNEPIEPIFEFVTSKYGNLDIGRRAFPAFIDIDGDGFLDLIVGNHEGELRYYRSDHSSGNVQWILESNYFLGYKGGSNAAPVLYDLDEDEDLDLLVGNQSGSIHYWENKGITEIADFVFNPTVFIGVTSGRNSVPAVIDLNKDGKKDVLMGKFNGQLYKYIRKDIGKEIRFMLERRKYLNLDVGLGSVPVFADLNNDQQPELIIGSDSGKIYSYKADSKKDSSNSWIPSDEYFKELTFPVGGNPVFADMDKDGDLDLIVGSEAGTLHYFRNEGQ